MIDVVFQLLVYFLLGSSIALAESVHRLDLPDRDAPRVRTASGTSVVDEPVRIELGASKTADEPLCVVRGLGPPRTVADADALRELLRGSLYAPSNPSGTMLARTPIVIAPLATTPWERAVEAFDVAVALGFERIVFTEPIAQSAPGEVR
jgi:hypothetical protein